MTQVEWRTAKNYPKYEVSSDGRVRNKETRCTLSPALRKDDYLQVSLFYDGGKRTSQKIHRLVAETFIPNPDNKPEVNHLDHEKTNNNVSNLNWATRSENLKDSYGKGINSLHKNRLKAWEKNRKRTIWWNAKMEISFYGSSADLIKHYPELNMNDANLSKVFMGKRETHQGWSLFPEE